MSVPILVGVIGWIIVAAAALFALALAAVALAMAMRRLWDEFLWPRLWLRMPWAQRRLIRRKWERGMTREWAWRILSRQQLRRTLLRRPILHRWLIAFLSRTGRGA